jgi:(p)ppGpp synthase/HD superfamily hydrolase
VPVTGQASLAGPGAIAYTAAAVTATRKEHTERRGEELSMTRAALPYAEHSHEGQRRRCDDAPFIQHPLEVADLLRSAGADDELIAAGLLHDVIEKCAVTREALNERFGTRVTYLVNAVTENPLIDGYAARKRALREQVARSGPDALTLFAADKLAKARELQIPGAKAPARRLAHYRQSLELLQRLLPNHPLTRQLGTELARVAARQSPVAHAALP